jgi:branched-subunit amino acid transport protein
LDGALKLWTVIVVVGALNYLSRLSFIAFFASREMPPLLARALKFVPAAMLTALVIPMVLTPSVAGDARRRQPAHSPRRSSRPSSRSSRAARSRRSRSG